ncbi:hypothetical protein [uncultured Ilyobacter sp.]|uniref:hypothetical protein n=1 Tax=uncultured Ilyobacter sp. TaxID=544433 RepID=UPI0029C8BAFD|nr:hypothetical protein [uncultured Ilyobacter sp.]
MFRFTAGIILAAFITQNIFFLKYYGGFKYLEDKNDERRVGMLTLNIIFLILPGYTISYFITRGRLFSTAVIIFFIGEIVKGLLKKKHRIREMDDVVKLSLILAAFNINPEIAYTQNLLLIFVTGFFYLIFCLIFGAINERLEYLEIPKFFEGGPIKLLTFALAAMTFYAFIGIEL